MSYYILKEKKPIKAKSKEAFIVWNNNAEENNANLIAKHKAKDMEIITKFYGYQQAQRSKISFFETHLLINGKLMWVLAQSKKWEEIVKQHKKYVGLLKVCHKKEMDFLATVQGY